MSLKPRNTDAKIQFEKLSDYLVIYMARSESNHRQSARQKLARLTTQQFHELSMDVCDELVRRTDEKGVPFLPGRDGFHPKRNEARRRLATLATSRFEDLSSDVHFELARRYPEFTTGSSGKQLPSSSYESPYRIPEYRPSEGRRRPTEQLEPKNARCSEDTLVEAVGHALQI